SPTLPMRSVASTFTSTCVGSPGDMCQVYRPVLSTLVANGTHGPWACSAYDSVTGRVTRFLSVAVQRSVSVRPLVSAPACVLISLTSGRVVSTSTQIWGGSPGCGGVRPSPTPLLATTVKPYKPSSLTSTGIGLCVGTRPLCLCQIWPLRVYHSSMALTPDGP